MKNHAQFLLSKQSLNSSNKICTKSDLISFVIILRRKSMSVMKNYDKEVSLILEQWSGSVHRCQSHRQSLQSISRLSGLPTASRGGEQEAATKAKWDLSQADAPSNPNGGFGDWYMPSACWAQLVFNTFQQFLACWVWTRK